MSVVTIGDFKIGEDFPPFIVAEAGINHNGELEKAYEMIEVAKSAGADAVKFQTFKAEEFVGSPKQTYSYKSQGKEITESMLEMFKRYEFSRDEWFKIKKKCEEVGIMFLSTPQNRSDLDLLLEVGISAIKVGSDDFTNLPLLKSYGYQLANDYLFRNVRFSGGTPGLGSGGRYGWIPNHFTAMYFSISNST